MRRGLIRLDSEQGLGFWGATALVVGNIIGSSIFMLPALLAPYGANALIAWAVSLAGAACVAYVYAQLSLHLPTNEGSHGHVASTLGDEAAWIGSWGYLLSTWTATAAVTVAGVSYCLALMPGVAHWAFGPTLLGLTVIMLLLLVNVRGMGGSVQIVSTVLKLIPFVLVIGLGVVLLVRDGHMVFSGMSPQPIGWVPAVASVGITLFALLGLESAAISARTVNDPQRTVPRATITGLAIAGAISVLVTCIVAFMMPVGEIAASSAPMADFIGRFMGSGVGMIIAIFGMVSCFGTLNGLLLVGGELTAAMAATGGLPKRAAQCSARGAPVIGLIFCSLISAVFVLLAFSRRGAAAFEFVALLTTTTTLVFFVVCTLAALQARRSGQLPESRTLMIACLGALVFSAIAFYSAGIESATWGAVCIAVGYAGRRWSNTIKVSLR